MSEDWVSRRRDGLLFFEAASAGPGLLVAFSGRGTAPPDEPSPTAYLARRFADALAPDGVPVVRATQVHGRRVLIVREPPGKGEVSDAGEGDVLTTSLPAVALAVQTADCVPILLAGKTAVAAAHAGWRGTVGNVAGAAVAALGELGEEPADIRAWLGPSIGPCCYEVGSEVANQFSSDFLRTGSAGRSFLDLAAANRAELASAGLSSARIQTHPSCTRCGGDQFASYRRDGTASGRMIGLILRRH